MRHSALQLPDLLIFKPGLTHRLSRFLSLQLKLVCEIRDNFIIHLDPTLELVNFGLEIFKAAPHVVSDLVLDRGNHLYELGALSDFLKGLIPDQYVTFQISHSAAQVF